MDKKTIAVTGASGDAVGASVSSANGTSGNRYTGVSVGRAEGVGVGDGDGVAVAEADGDGDGAFSAVRGFAQANAINPTNSSSATPTAAPRMIRCERDKSIRPPKSFFPLVFHSRALAIHGRN